MAVKPSDYPPPVDPAEEFVGPPTDPEDERIDVGVAIVGGGPGGLACAIRIMQLLEDEPELAEKLGEVPVAVIEKGKATGAHLLSGANMRPSAMRELFPDLEPSDWPVYQEVEKDAVYLLTKKRALPLKPMPPNFRNHGNYVTSVAKLGRFLGEKAEEAGAYLLTETAADRLLVEDRIVRGVRSGDKGRGRDGEELANFEPGSDVVAKATVLAEGTQGHLTGAAIDYFDLQGHLPQRWELGVKEIWEVEKPLDRVIHTMGWPLRKRAKWNEFGGSFIYPMGEDKVSLGLVVGLDYTDATFSVHDALQLLKTHPFVEKHPRGRQARRLGREDDSLRRLLGAAAQALRARDGDLRRRRRNGQRPRAQGHPLRDARRHVRGRDDRGAAQAGLDQLRGLPRPRREEHDRQGHVPLAQHAPALLARLLRRRRDRLGDDDHPRRLPGRDVEAEARRRGADGDRRRRRKKYPKPDNKYIFDKLSSVFASGNATRDDAPNHIRVQTHVPREVAQTWVSMCPAQVYEIPEEQQDNGEAEVDLTIVPSNCVQCGAITAKGGRLTPPEGGDGPLYQET